MRLGITDAVKHLIIINVVMFIGTLTLGNGNLFYEWFAMYFPKSDFFQPWQIVTHMFMHGSPAHILFNMFAILVSSGPLFFESESSLEKCSESDKRLLNEISPKKPHILTNPSFHNALYRN